jgi:hypothetical protein
MPYANICSVPWSQRPGSTTLRTSAIGSPTASPSDTAHSAPSSKFTTSDTAACAPPGKATAGGVPP